MTDHLVCAADQRRVQHCLLLRLRVEPCMLSCTQGDTAWRGRRNINTSAKGDAQQDANRSQGRQSGITHLVRGI